MVYFDSSSFQIYDEIEFEIKVTSFNNDINEINYEFLDDKNLPNAGTNVFTLEALKTKKKEENG